MFIVSCKRKNHTYKFMINAKGQIHSSDSTCLTWDNIMTYLSKDLYYLNLITNSRTFPSVMAAPGVWAMFLMRKWDVTLLCFAFELEECFRSQRACRERKLNSCDDTHAHCDEQVLFMAAILTGERKAQLIRFTECWFNFNLLKRQ